MTYRKQLTVLETEFYGADEVKGIIDGIEGRVNEIKDLLDNYSKWSVEELESKLDEVKCALSDLSSDLY